MKKKKKLHLLVELIEREREHLANQDVGSEEYCKSQERLLNLEKAYEEVSKNKADMIIKYSLEGAKIVVGVVVSTIGLIWITATEKENTFTGQLKEYCKLFIPKRFF